MKFIFAVFALFAAAVFADKKSTACLSCTTTCAILPPTGQSFPCYQGSPEDSNFCYDTDPLLPAGKTWQCGTCEQYGYPNYIQNDPIYKNMGLWN